jgi:hypothetical protein
VFAKPRKLQVGTEPSLMLFRNPVNFGFDKFKLSSLLLRRINAILNFLRLP